MSDYQRAKYLRLREAGSCQDCGAEATNSRTRCTPCGQRNAANAARRRAKALPRRTVLA